MGSSLPGFFLGVILIDGKTEAYIVIEPHTTPEYWLLVYPGLVRSEPTIEPTRDISLNNNPDATGSRRETDIPNREVKGHTTELGSDISQ